MASPLPEQPSPPRPQESPTDSGPVSDDPPSAEPAPQEPQPPAPSNPFIINDLFSDEPTGRPSSPLKEAAGSDDTSSVPIVLKETAGPEKTTNQEHEAGPIGPNNEACGGGTTPEEATQPHIALDDSHLPHRAAAGETGGELRPQEYLPRPFPFVGPLEPESVAIPTSETVPLNLPKEEEPLVETHSSSSVPTHTGDFEDEQPIEFRPGDDTAPVEADGLEPRSGEQHVPVVPHAAGSQKVPAQYPLPTPASPMGGVGNHDQNAGQEAFVIAARAKSSPAEPAPTSLPAILPSQVPTDIIRVADELDLWWGSFSGWAMLPSFGLCLLATGLIAWLRWLLVPSWMVLYTIEGLTGALWIVQLTRWVYRVFGYNYRLTNRRLFVDRGWLYSDAHRVDLLQVQNVRVAAGWWQRIIGAGNVVLEMNGDPRITLVLEAVRFPQRVARQLQHIIDLSRELERPRTSS